MTYDLIYYSIKVYIIQHLFLSLSLLLLLHLFEPKSRVLRLALTTGCQILKKMLLKCNFEKYEVPQGLEVWL